MLSLNFYWFVTLAGILVLIIALLFDMLFELMGHHVEYESQRVCGHQG
jgi:hypothetical protein